MDFHKKCREVYNRSRTGTIAAFDTIDDIKILPAEGRRFDVMLRDFGKGFIGVYDSRCTLKMIQEDIL